MECSGLEVEEEGNGIGKEKNVGCAPPFGYSSSKAHTNYHAIFALSADLGY